MRRRIDHNKSDGICGTLFPPHSDWTPPKSFPNLSGAKVVGLDIESRDPNLEKRGPGFIRGDASIVGVSVSVEDRSWYFPFGHLGGGNMDRAGVVRFITDLVKDPDRFICGANLQYELEGLDAGLEIEVKSKLIDVQIAEALIDEESESVALQALCYKYLKNGKDETLLREAASVHGLDPKTSLWKLHSKYVGPYAEYDALAPLLIFKEQLKILEAENLESIFTLESRLLPLLWKMRKRGIRINTRVASALSAKLLAEENQLRAESEKKFNCKIDEWSGPQIAAQCDRMGIRYPRTAAGNPSFTADYLENTSQPFFDVISDLRELNKMRQTFVDKWVFDNIDKCGFIHPQWKQVASDDGGTRTGRMAASNPNPQQIPAGKYRKTGKPNEIGKIIRSMFIPHEDGLKWAKFDYSEQEPRILVHYAAICKMTRAEEVAARYRDSREFKIYPLMMEWCGGIDKRVAKDMYLGRCYGMGKAKMAIKLNKSESETEAMLKLFDTGCPFVKEIADSCMNSADKRGYIRTLLGRKRHFNLWEPMEWGRMQPGEMPLRREAAIEKWGQNIRRSQTHKALNALIQGSAADMLKAGALKVYEEHGDMPYMLVHDESNFGVRDQAHAMKLNVAVETCVDMCVPVIANLSYGDHWK